MYYEKLLPLIDSNLVSKENLNKLDEYLASLSLEESRYIYPDVVSRKLDIDGEIVDYFFYVCLQAEICSNIFVCKCPNDSFNTPFFQTSNQNELIKTQECRFCDEGEHIPQTSCEINVIYCLSEDFILNKKKSTQSNPINQANRIILKVLEHPIQYLLQFKSNTTNI